MATPADTTIVCGCSPRNTEREVEALLDLGAGELFAGYVPRAWLDTFGMEVSPNRRYTLGDQFTDPGELARFAELARGRGAGFVLALNEHYYAPDAWPLLDEIVATGLDLGASGFIVADLALLARLRAAVPADVELIVSQEAGFDSVASGRLFAAHGATRLIFARETRLSEMAPMAAELAATGVSFEAFVAREFCINSSSRCFACHGYGFAGSFCVSPVQRALVDRAGGASRPLPTVLPGYHFDLAFQRAFRALNRCGLCAIAPILEMGVRYLKVPGRSSYAREALELLDRLFEAGDLAPEACRRLVDSESFCSGYQCYYALDAAPSQPEPPVTEAPAPAAADPRAQRPPAEPLATPQLELYLPAGTVGADLVERLAADGLRGAVMRDGALLAPWERDVAVACLDGLEARGLDVDAPPARVQLGLEVCALRLPGVRALGGELQRLRDAGFAVSLVLPVAYEALWGRLLRLVDAAVERTAGELELVVNDLGLLAHAATSWPVALATGRLLNRMKRDQLAADDAVRPAATGLSLAADSSGERADDRLLALRRQQQAVYGYPYLTHPFYAAHLHSHGVGCVGMDVLPTPLSAGLDGSFEHAVYLPWTCVAITRACRLASAVAGTPISHPTDACGRPCCDHAIALDYPFGHRRTIQSGAGIFIDCTDALDSFLESAAPQPRRLVFEPAVPW